MASFKKVLRSRADSNRCTSFCRALPSHSATRPDWGAKLQRFPRIQGIFFQKGHAHCVNIPINGRIQFANLDFRADYSAGAREKFAALFGDTTVSSNLARWAISSLTMMRNAT